LKVFRNINIQKKKDEMLADPGDKRGRPVSERGFKGVVNVRSIGLHTTRG